MLEEEKGLKGKKKKKGEKEKREKGKEEKEKRKAEKREGERGKKKRKQQICTWGKIYFGVRTVWDTVLAPKNLMEHCICFVSGLAG